MELSEIKVKPIKNSNDYKYKMQAIELLWDSHEGSKETEMLEVLSILADEYENKHFPIASPDRIEAIKYRMEQLKLSQKDLAKYLGAANRVSEVLNKKRPLTLKMIKALYHHLHIPAEALLA